LRWINFFCVCVCSIYIIYRRPTLLQQYLYTYSCSCSFVYSLAVSVFTRTWLFHHGFSVVIVCRAHINSNARPFGIETMITAPRVQCRGGGAVNSHARLARVTYCSVYNTRRVRILSRVSSRRRRWWCQKNWSSYKSCRNNLSPPTLAVAASDGGVGGRRSPKFFTTMAERPCVSHIKSIR